MDLISSLNKQQKEAVETTEGAVLVLAGAGSGKTKVLTHRIAYIIQQKLAQPDQILAVTFTNKAAGEMKERIAKLLNGDGKSNSSGISWCGTFHSICVRILRRDGEKIGLNNNFTIYDGNDSLDTVKEAMDNLFMNKKDINPNAVRATISSAKNELINSYNYAQYAGDYFQEKVAQVYPEYQKILRDNQALDFDDLIMKTIELFEVAPQVLARYRAMFRYVHVDEYQDTNQAQYILIKKLTTKNICVVGDDDQSIYGFRGANIKNILNFEKDFPDTKVIKLEQNYRSTKTILEASHSIVRQNQNRHDKKLWTENRAGEKIDLFTALDEDDEAKWVASKVKEFIDGESEPCDIAILYRTNAQSRTIEEAFLKNSIPYKIVGGIRFYDRKEIKDLLAYLHIVSNPQDKLGLKRIYNTPRRGIGAKTFEALEETAKSLNQSPIQFLVNEKKSFDQPKLRILSELLIDLIKGVTEYRLPDFVKFVLERTGYLEYLNDGTSENQSRIENLKELVSVAERYKELPGKEALEKFLEDVALLEESSDKNVETNAVTLMTIHASKGLEFRHVFLVGMEEMLFPHSRSYAEPSEMEEERRLAYVAVTRAKENLHITHAEGRVFFGKFQSNPISRFVSDIPSEIIFSTISDSIIDQSNDAFSGYTRNNKQREVYEDNDYVAIEVKPGDYVRHEIFGKGKVEKIIDDSIVIDFGPGKGKKELIMEYARLERV